VRLAVHFGIIFGKNGPPPPHFWEVFLGTLIFASKMGTGYVLPKAMSRVPWALVPVPTFDTPSREGGK
jgi:hypothetical protein